MYSGMTEIVRVGSIASQQEFKNLSKLKSLDESPDMNFDQQFATFEKNSARSSRKNTEDDENNLIQ